MDIFLRSAKNNIILEGFKMKKRPLEKELKEYDSFYTKDTDFASHARLLQSKWRVKKGYPMNNEKRSDYGNFVETKYAKQYKVNYLTENIKNIVSEKIIEIRKSGGLVGEPRIWNNLLSSQPLCFNLFGELHTNLELATEFFKELFPDKITEVTKVDFEYSSRRGKPDNSAFDVFVEYSRGNTRGFIGIEVKYQESLREESQKKANKIFEKHGKKYFDLAREANVFKTDSFEELKTIPLAQMWRDHLLCFNMMSDYDEGFFIFLYPFENKECNEGVKAYTNLLVSKNEQETLFYPRDLSLFIKILRKIHNKDWTKELEERYLI